MTDRRPEFQDWILLCALGLMWGSGFYFIKKSVVSFDPLQMTFLRMAISTVVSIPIFLWFVKRIDWTQWKSLLMVAIFGYGFPNYLFAMSEKDNRVTSGVAGVLNSTVPLMAMTIGIVFFRARTTKRKVVGILTGLFGAAWLVALSSGTQSAQPFYAAACVLAASMYAVNANVIGTYLRKFHPLSISAAAFSISGPVYLIGVWTSGAMTEFFALENRSAAVAVVYLAIVSTVIGSFLYNWLVQRTNAVFATSVAYLFPLVSLALGTLDGESLGWVQLLGAAFILIGLFLSRH